MDRKVSFTKYELIVLHNALKHYGSFLLDSRDISDEKSFAYHEFHTVFSIHDKLLRVLLGCGFGV